MCEDNCMKYNQFVYYQESPSRIQYDMWLAPPAPDFIYLLKNMCCQLMFVFNAIPSHKSFRAHLITQGLKSLCGIRRVIIKIHILFLVQFLVTSNISFHVFLYPFSFAHITVIQSHNMHHHDKTISRYVVSPRTFQSVVLQTYNYSLQENKIIIVMSKVVKYIIYREIIHNLGYQFYFFHNILDMQLCSII